MATNCTICEVFDSPEQQDNEEDDYSWIACSNYSFWYDQVCVVLQQIPIFWLYDTCKST